MPANQRQDASGSQRSLIDSAAAAGYDLGIANTGFTVEELDITSPPPMPQHPILVVDQVCSSASPTASGGSNSSNGNSSSGGCQLQVPIEVSRTLSEGLPEVDALRPSFKEKRPANDSKSEPSINSLRVDAAASERPASSLSESVSKKLRELRGRFESRANSLRESTIQPLSESESDDESTATDKKSGDEQQEKNKHLVDLIAEPDASDEDEASKGRRVTLFGKFTVHLPTCRSSNTVDPQGKIYMMWLSLVTTALVYNSLSIPLRSMFTIYDPPSSSARIAWLFCDYIADLIYVLDILVKMRVNFVNEGIIERDPKKCMKNYIAKVDFRLDLASLFPLDFLYFAIGIVPIVRFHRVLKFKTFWEMFDRLDKMVTNGHIIRILRTISYMIYLIHLEACFYYQVSKWQGFGINNWVFNEKWNVTAYIYCFYLATKTATSIGNNPKPTNYIEHLFMTAYWLSGVFVFALLIGQIRDIFQAANANKTNYRKTMDITTWYMKSLNVPEYMLDKVRMWFNYNWEQQKTLNENSLLEGLPKKLKTDLAIHVHYGILSKVSLFQDCDRTLLSDLILKLEPVLYLPGDYICRKGEVGSEMYIIMNGQVEVVGGPNNSIVFVTLKEGSVFGEISLLALSGGNRRTADVRAKGFSTLFTLSKVDFEEAMRDYPQAYAQLKKRAKKTLTKSKVAKEEKKKPEVEEIIKEREATPKLLHTVIKAVSKERPTSALSKFFTPSTSKAVSKQRRKKPEKLDKPPEDISHSKSQLQATEQNENENDQAENQDQKHNEQPQQEQDQTREEQCQQKQDDKCEEQLQQKQDHKRDEQLQQKQDHKRDEQSQQEQGQKCVEQRQENQDPNENSQVKAPPVAGVSAGNVTGDGRANTSRQSDSPQDGDAFDSDIDSVMSEVSISLPDMEDLETEIKTPPPTSDDTPAILMEKLKLHADQTDEHGLDKAEILDETAPAIEPLKSEPSSSKLKESEKKPPPKKNAESNSRPHAAASPDFKRPESQRQRLATSTAQQEASSQVLTQRKGASVQKQQQSKTDPSVAKPKQNTQSAKVAKRQAPQSHRSTPSKNSRQSSKVSPAGQLQSKTQTLPMKQLTPQSHSKSGAAQATEESRSQPKSGAAQATEESRSQPKLGGSSEAKEKQQLQGEKSQPAAVHMQSRSIKRSSQISRAPGKEQSDSKEPVKSSKENNSEKNSAGSSSSHVK